MKIKGEMHKITVKVAAIAISKEFSTQNDTKRIFNEKTLRLANKQRKKFKHLKASYKRN